MLCGWIKEGTHCCVKHFEYSAFIERHFIRVWRQKQVFTKARLTASQTGAHLTLMFFRFMKQLFLKNNILALRNATLSNIRPLHFWMTPFVQVHLAAERRNGRGQVSVRPIPFMEMAPLHYGNERGAVSYTSSRLFVFLFSNWIEFISIAYDKIGYSFH